MIRPVSKLGRLRVSRGLAVEDLGRILGCTPWSVRALEMGRRKIRPAEARLLEELFGVPLDEIVTFNSFFSENRP